MRAMRLLLVGLVACSAAPRTESPREIAPPVAAKRPHDVVSPHGTRSDPYYWLRDKTPETIAYLEAENAYAKAMLAPAQPIEDALVKEMRARVEEDSTSVPFVEDGFAYYTRYERGKQHAIVARKPAAGGAEQVLIDANQLAAGKAFYVVGDWAVSPDGRLLAWTEDLAGKNQFALHVKDLASGKLLADTATNLAPTLVWANDNKTLFFVGRDPISLREDRVFRHVIGSGQDELVYHEEDSSFYVDIGVTKSRKYITIDMDATTISETRLIDADHPSSPPAVFRARQADRIYDLDHLDDTLYVRTNDRGDNFRIVAIDKTGNERELIPPRDDTFVQSFTVSRHFLAVSVRRGGLARIRVVPRGKVAFDVDSDEPAFAMGLVDVPDPDAARVRYTYDSLTSPNATYEVDIDGHRTLLQREQTPSYDPARYTSEYLHAGDVPISLVHRKDLPRDGKAPILLLGYGAYGDSFEPAFDRERVSLLDRGWVVAIAHVRGGAELGHAWYEAGRLLEKKHSFTDFIAVAEYLRAQHYGNRLYADGGSAGGLLVATVANMRPDLFTAIIAWVPFVDAVTTMLDESLPLTTNEYDEWGDPREREAYDYMLSYSPYDNIGAHPYPALYVRTGLADGLVSYHEPAKWVAKLRATATGRAPLLFETDMHAGHGGTMGRYDSIREEARAYAFLLWIDVRQ
jgi:oligopeptidase B